MPVCVHVCGCVHVEARSWCQVSSSIALYCIESGSLPWAQSSLVQIGYLSVCFTDLPFLSSKHWDHRWAAVPSWYWSPFSMLLFYDRHLAHRVTTPTLVGLFLFSIICFKTGSHYVVYTGGWNYKFVPPHWVYCSQSQRKALRHSRGLVFVPTS